MKTRNQRAGIALIAKAIVLGVGLGSTVVLRLARLFPNNDPIMAVVLPCAKRDRTAAFVFPVLAMVVFDFVSHRVGVWTAVTAGTYGFLGLGFSYLYAHLARCGRKVGRMAFLASGAAGVVLFDFVTGPIMSSLIFDMPFTQAFMGQIPFTARHLASVSVYALAISPLLDWSLGRLETLQIMVLRRLEAAKAK